MFLPTVINLTNLFQIQFHSNFESTFCKQTVETLIRHFAGSGLGLDCLPMSHKKDARLIWVKYLPACGSLLLLSAVNLCK